MFTFYIIDILHIGINMNFENFFHFYNFAFFYIFILELRLIKLILNISIFDNMSKI